MATNITTAVFSSASSYANASSLWQYDYGQVLRIQGLNLPKAVEIHFALNETYGNSVTRIGTTKDGATDVIIPDSMLEYGNTSQNYNIYAFIFFTDSNSGNTEYRIKIPVKARPKPEIPGIPEEPELFRETVKAVNDAADRAEASERNAKASEERAKEHADCASESLEEINTGRENALREITEKQTESLNAVQNKTEESISGISIHVNSEIERINQEATNMDNKLKESIVVAEVKKTALDELVNASNNAKGELDKSIESGEESKTNLDDAVATSNKAKSDLDRSIEEATNKKTVLDKSVVQANELDKALGLKITEGNQLNKDIAASGNKAVTDINTAGDTKLKAMNDVAEEFTADREQISVNKAEISSLKEDIASKANKISLAITNRKLDALWKINQGIGYEFQTDDTEAYQKNIPTGAKLASVRQLGGKTIAYNQLLEGESAVALYSAVTVNGDIITITPEGNSNRYGAYGVDVVKGHKYLQTIIIKSDGVHNVGFQNYLYLLITDKINDASFVRLSVIGIAKETGKALIQLIGTPQYEYHIKKGSFQLFDLTQMFGYGNEPSTVEEFEAMFPKDYYPFNTGKLLNMPVIEMENAGKYSHLFSDYQKKWLVENYEKWHTDEIMLFKSASSNNIYVVKKADNITASIFIYYETITDTIHEKAYGNISFNADNILLYNKEIFITKNPAVKFEAVSALGTLGLPQVKIAIPQAILDLPGYGWSAGAVYNYVDWENKKYIQRVATVGLDSLKFGSGEYEGYKYFNTTDTAKFIKPSTTNTLCNRYTHATMNSVTMQKNMEIVVDSKAQLFLRNESMKQDTALLKNALNGVILYYELTEPIITDVTDIIPEGFLEAIEVEAGESLTFQNSNGDDYKVPVPNAVEYAVKLREVAQ